MSILPPPPLSPLPLTSLPAPRRRRDFSRPAFRFYKARIFGEISAEGGPRFGAAKAARNAAAEAFLAVSAAGVRALSSPSPGLKIGPEEIERYMATAMASVPWT